MDDCLKRKNNADDGSFELSLQLSTPTSSSSSGGPIVVHQRCRLVLLPPSTSDNHFDRIDLSPPSLSQITGRNRRRLHLLLPPSPSSVRLSKTNCTTVEFCHLKLDLTKQLLTYVRIEFQASKQFTKHLECIAYRKEVRRRRRR